MGLSQYFKLHYWPGITCGWFTCTFVVSYLVSVLDGHVYAFFPFISDTGTLQPESCIFGQMLNIGAVLMAITMYIRYCQVDLGINSQHIELTTGWNTSAIITGSLAAFGMSIVANFQQTVGPMHFLGAVLAFGIGIIYFYTQTRISFAYYKINSKSTAKPYKISKSIFYTRIVLAFCLLPLFVANLACTIIAKSQFTGEAVVWWTKEDGGFQVRLAATFTEWIIAIFMFIYLATYTEEFKTLKLKPVEFELKPTNSRNSSVNATFV